MDIDKVERLCEEIMDVLHGEEYDVIMVALGAVHNLLAVETTSDETRLRSLYNMMADSAVCMALMDDDKAEFPTEKNTKQKKRAKKARQKGGDEPGPFGSH